MNIRIAAITAALAAAVVLTGAMMVTGGGTQTADAGETVSTTPGVTKTPGTTKTPGVTQTPGVTRTTVGVTRTPAITPTVARGGEGCTPGYWKVRPHRDSWPPTGYTTGQTLESVFDVPDAYGIDNVSLLAALSFGGGPTTTDAAKMLLHHAVAGLLNSAHPGVDYDISTADLIADVNAALATNSRSIMLDLKNEIDAENNSGCPLN